MNRVVGSRERRLEDLRLLTGRDLFVDDVEIRGKLFGAVARSPLTHAWITSADMSSTIKLDGGKAIYTAADLGELGKPLRPLSLCCLLTPWTTRKPITSWLWIRFAMWANPWPSLLPRTGTWPETPQR